MADPLVIVVIPLAPHDDRSASLRLVSVKAENFANNALPTAVEQVRQRFVFMAFAVVVVAVEQVAVHVTAATGLATHALFQALEAWFVDSPVAIDLTRLLGAPVVFVVSFILTHLGFCFD